MTTEQHLQDRAHAAAAAVLDKHTPQLTGTDREVVELLIGLGWVEGWAAGGEDARVIVRDFIEGLAAQPVPTDIAALRAMRDTPAGDPRAVRLARRLGSSGELT